jgi:hypothetical protein
MWEEWVRNMAQMVRKLLSLSFDDPAFNHHAWKDNKPAGEQLQTVTQAFVAGYNTGIACDETVSLAQALNIIVPTFRGFAFEGAAMAWALLDAIRPWRPKLIPKLLRGEGWRHRYMVYVGAGWALARLPAWFLPKLAQDDLLPWLMWDGYGFHEGYFKARQYCLSVPPKKPKLSGYAARVFNQGLGRSLWFVCAADIDFLGETIGHFPPADQPDLWSGVALACTYAGGCPESSIEQLRATADAFHPQVAQGAAFAAKARIEANILTHHTEVACEILCDASAEVAARETDLALRELTARSADEPAFEVWRQRIQTAFRDRREEQCFYSVG